MVDHFKYEKNYKRTICRKLDLLRMNLAVKDPWKWSGGKSSDQKAHLSLEIHIRPKRQSCKAA